MGPWSNPIALDPCHPTIFLLAQEVQNHYIESLNVTLYFQQPMLNSSNSVDSMSSLSLLLLSLSSNHASPVHFKLAIWILSLYLALSKYLLLIIFRIIKLFLITLANILFSFSIPCTFYPNGFNSYVPNCYKY